MDIALQVVLSPFLGVLLDRIAKPEFLNLFRKRKYDDRILKKLKWKLLILQGVLEDAENKQSKNPAVQEWIEELQEVLYKTDDLLNQISTEALRVEVESEYQNPTGQVSASTDPSNFSVDFLREIMPELETIVENLEDFEQKIGFLGLIKEVESKRIPLRPSTSLVNENDVFGRDADKEKIIQALFSDVRNRENFSVISIVGLGGVGKTTLAQFIYNDVRLKFDTKAWVCISEEYDPIRITKELLAALNVYFGPHEGFDSLQVKLKQGLSGKKFLLVLDDIWNRDYNDWLVLSAPFGSGKEGSKIIATTRDENVASVMGSQFIYHLNLLSEENSWSLFKKHAFNDRENTGVLEFELIGKDIVKKCGGLPLAIKAIAGLLRSKETIEEWNEILRSDEWAQTNNQAGILPSLRLSYTHLSSHLKCCFAYCALFPKDYQFNKDKVILFWMASDLLECPRSNKRLEDIGNEFFHELTMRSFFQKSSDGRFSMHDLVNDLAKHVAGKYFLRLEDHQQQNGSLIVVRHFSYIISKTDEFKKFKHLNKSKFLRTFLPIVFNGGGLLSPKVLFDVLPAFKSLRILSLFGYVITELPNSFANLKQLRFLDLSCTLIKKLPSWICTFCNLQTLLLAGCWYLEVFPEDMEKLISLRYLDVRDVPLTKMPIEIGRLKNLQFLSTFIVSKYSGSSIEDLGKLCNLHRVFSISGLENVAKVKNASMAKLKEKKDIKKLNLEWTGDSHSSRVAQDVFEELKPNSNIEILAFKGYGGTRFPSWLENPSSFCCMVSLSISKCKNCFSLPAIGQLPSLKYLSISGLSKVIEMGPEIYGDGCMAKPFPCLKELRIEKMEEWREWHIPGDEVFSCLEELYIEYCPKLIGAIPKQLPSLKRCEISICPKLMVEIPLLLSSLGELSISKCPQLVNFDGELTLFDSKVEICCLQELRIENMRNLKKLSSSYLNKVFPRLEKLNISKCEDMVSFPISGLPTTLKRLEIRDARNLELGTRETCHVSIEELEIWGAAVSIKNLSLGLFHSLGRLSLYEVDNIEELSIPTSLQYLHISGCDDLMSFTVGGLPAPNLTELQLWYLPKLKSWPERMHTLLPSLRDLYLENCPEIECFPGGGLLSSLQFLHIGNCERLWSCRREWGLHRLPSLWTFEFWNTYGVETFPSDDLLLPCTVRSLFLACHQNLKTLNSWVLQHLTSLQSLSILDCPKLQSLPKGGLPASLSKLCIKGCLELHSLPEEGLPAFLCKLEIHRCCKLRSLPKMGLPDSLSELHIYDCCELLSFPEVGLPTSLSELRIYNCHELRSLPEVGLPNFLSKLYISNCPLLKQRLEWEKGEDWPKVTHIPFILVDDDLIP